MTLRRVLLLGVLFLMPSAPADAIAADPARAGNVATLEERLKAGLRTRLPAENEFVEKVVMLVQIGKLPAKIVDATYIWAIDRRKEYPFPAFEKALRMQAERLGVRL